MEGVFKTPHQNLLTAFLIAMIFVIAYLSERKTDDLETELAILIKQEHLLETKYEDLKAKVDLMDSAPMKILETKAVTQMQQLKQVKFSKITFYARGDINQTNLGVNQTLIFGITLTNEGNCYDHSTGNFIPTVSGVYVLDVRILLCSPGHELRTHIVVEGVEKGAYYTGGASHCSNGGGVSVVRLKAGERVWVRVATSDGENNIAWESSFSGFLLYT